MLGYILAYILGVVTAPFAMKLYKIIKTKLSQD